MHKTGAAHSPVLWSAVAIPVVSATELFVDPATRGSFGFFILGSFYLASVRYTLAVCLGVLAHDQALTLMHGRRTGACLWWCYFLVLVLCSLLVPGAAIFGFAVTTGITMSIIGLSLAQGFLSLDIFPDATVARDVRWRIVLDVLLMAFLVADIFRVGGPTFQSVFFGLVALLAVDFTISESGRRNLEGMWRGVCNYMRESWAAG